MEIGRRIEYAMKEVLGLTQKELEAKTGISQSTLSRIINGQYNLNSPSGHKYLEKIAKSLGEEVHIYLSDQDLLDSDIKALEEKLMPGKKIGIFIHKHLGLSLETVSEETEISIATLQRIMNGNMVLTDKVGSMYVSPLCELINKRLSVPLTQPELLQESLESLEQRLLPLPSQSHTTTGQARTHSPTVKKRRISPQLIPWIVSGVLMSLLLIQYVSPINLHPPRDEIISVKAQDKHSHTFDVYGTLSNSTLTMLDQGYHAWLVMEVYTPHNHHRCLFPKEPEISYFYSKNRWIAQVYNDPTLIPDTLGVDERSQLDMSLFLVDSKGHQKMLIEMQEGRLSNHATYYHQFPHGVRVFRTNVL